jgi:lipopolysaccharide transport system permease protein
MPTAAPRRSGRARRAVASMPRVFIIEPRPSLKTWLDDVWAYRGVLGALCLREIRGKYKQATLGVAWALVQPLVQVAIFTFAFQRIAHVATPVAYPLFALSALLPFNLFAQIITFGTPAFAASQGLVTKIYFPRLYTVLAASASSVVNAVVASAALAVAMGVYGIDLSPRLLLMVPTILATMMLAVGVSAVLGVLNARFRDAQHALPLLMTAMLYFSPVLYPLEAMPTSVRTLALWNPVTGLVDGFRSAATGAPLYSLTYTLLCAGVAVVVFVAGIFVFERTQARLIDVL